MSERREDQRIDAGLARLLCVASTDHAGEIERPDEEALGAYIAGNATDEQTTAVESALQNSAELRDELLAYRQAERDLASDDLAERMARVDLPQGLLEEPEGEAALARPFAPADTGSFDGSSLVARIADWLWAPQAGYALAVAATLLFFVFRVGGPDRLAEGPPSLGFPPVRDLRGAADDFHPVHLLPGRETFDMVPLMSLDADALERYHVDAELRSHPDSTLILSVANLRDSVPSHDGGIFLRWRVPVKVLAQGRYAASFRLLAPDDPGEVIEEILVRLEVVGSGSE